MKHYLLPLLLGFLTAGGLAAQEAEPLNFLEVEWSETDSDSGTPTTRINYIEFAAQPEITCYHQVMKVAWQDAEEGQQELQLQRPVRLRLVPASKVAVGSLQGDAAPGRVLFDMKEAGVVRVRGIKQGVRVQAFATDGRAVATAVAGGSGEAIVNLKSQPRGMYLISVNQRETFKIMKP